MGLFERTHFAEEGEEAGVFISSLGAALVTWTAMQLRSPVTVAEAAMAFNTTPDIIRDAIADAMWIFVAGEPTDPPDKQTIELDGC